MVIILFNPYNAEIVSYKVWTPKVFSILSHHKCISQLFPLYLNTYVKDLTSKVDPGAGRVK